MTNIFTREEIILESLQSLSSGEAKTLCTSITQIAKKTGLSLKDACLGLVKLWLIQGEISVCGLRSSTEPFEVELREGKRGTIRGDREGSRAIKIDLLKSNNVDALLRQESIPGKDSQEKIKQVEERKENESVREGEKREIAELLRQRLGEVKEKYLYATIAEKYPADVIGVALRKTLDVPEGKIKKTRLALFRFLLKKFSAEKVRTESLLEKVIPRENAEKATPSTLEDKDCDATLNKMPAGAAGQEKVETGKFSKY